MYNFLTSATRSDGWLRANGALWPALQMQLDRRAQSKRLRLNAKIRRTL